jgi:hypothetical protein
MDEPKGCASTVESRGNSPRHQPGRGGGHNRCGSAAVGTAVAAEAAEPISTPASIHPAACLLELSAAKAQGMVLLGLSFGAKLLWGMAQPARCTMDMLGSGVTTARCGQPVMERPPTMVPRTRGTEEERRTLTLCMWPCRSHLSGLKHTPTWPLSTSQHPWWPALVTNEWYDPFRRSVFIAQAVGDRPCCCICGSRDHARAFPLGCWSASDLYDTRVACRGHC